MATSITYTRNNVGYPYVRLTASTSTSNRTANSVKVTMNIKIEMNGFTVSGSAQNAWLHVKYGNTEYLNINYLVKGKPYSSPYGKYSTIYNATHTFTMGGLGTGSSSPTFTITSTCSSSAWDSFIWTVPGSNSLSVSIPAAPQDIRISGSIKSYTNGKNTTQTSGNHTYPASGKRIYFNLDNIRVTTQNLTATHFLIYAEKYNRNSNGGVGSRVGFVTDRLHAVNMWSPSKTLNNWNGANWAGWPINYKTYFIDINDDERGYYFKINVIADVNNVTNSLNKHGWNNGSGIVYGGSNMSVNKKPIVGSLEWTSNQTFAGYVTSFTGNGGTGAWNRTTNNIVVKPGSSVYSYCKYYSGLSGISISKFESWYQKPDNSWVKVNNWWDGNFGGQVFSISIPSNASRGNIVYKNAYVRVTDSVGDYTDWQLSRNIYVNKLPYLHNLWWSASKYVTTGATGTAKGWGNWSRSNIIIPSGGTNLRMACGFYSYYTGIASIESKICGKDPSYKAYSHGEANANNSSVPNNNGLGIPGPWTESTLWFNGGNYSGTSYVKLTDSLGESSTISFTYTITKNTPPSISSVSWYGSKFVKESQRYSGSLSSGYCQEDIYVPRSSNSTITIKANISNSGAAIDVNSERMVKNGDIANGDIGGTMTRTSSYIQCVVSVNESKIISGTNRVLIQSPQGYVKDVLGDVGTGTLSKWAYCNCGPQLSSPDWTADAFLVRSSSTGEINTTKKVMRDMTNEDMIIPSQGCNILARCTQTDWVAITNAKITIDYQTGTSRAVTHSSNPDRCWWDSNSKLHGNVSCSGKGQGDAYKGARFYSIDVLGDSATIEFSKWAYVNTKPAFTNLRWSADKFVRNSNKSTAITNTEKSGSKYYNETIIFPNAGTNLHIWAEHNPRTNIMAPIKSRTLKYGGSGGPVVSTSPSINSTGFWASKWITDTKTDPYAYMIDYLDESVSLTRSGISAIRNTPPSLSAGCWSADKYLDRTSSGNINTTAKGKDTYTTNNMIIPSTGQQAYFKCNFTNNNANLTYGYIKIDEPGINYSIQTSSTQTTTNYCRWSTNNGSGTFNGGIYLSSYTNGNGIYKTCIWYLQDALGDSSSYKLVPWIYVNIKPSFTNLRISADKFVRNSNKNALITNTELSGSKYYNEDITVPNAGSNMHIWAEHPTRSNQVAPLKTRVIKVGGSSGTSLGNINSNSTGFWSSTYITRNTGTPYVYIQDCLGETASLQRSITAYINSKPTLTSIEWSATKYLTRTSAGSIDTSAKTLGTYTNENMIIPSYGVDWIYLRANYTHNVGIINYEAKFDTNSGSTPIHVTKANSSVCYLNTTEKKYYAKFQNIKSKSQGSIYKQAYLKIEDVLGDNAYLELGKWIYVNVKPSFTNLRWTADAFVKDSARGTRINGGVNASNTYCNESIWFPNAGTNITILAEHPERLNTVAPLKSRVIKDNDSGGTTWSNTPKTNATGFWFTKRITSQITKPYAYIQDCLGETASLVKNITAYRNTAPSMSNIEWTATKYLKRTGSTGSIDTTIKSLGTYINEDMIIPSQGCNGFITRCSFDNTGANLSYGYIKLDTASGGSNYTVATNNTQTGTNYCRWDANTKKFMGAMTLTAKKNGGIYKNCILYLKDVLDDWSQISLGKNIYTNVKPTWASGASIFINDINNRNVVVSKSATSAKIAAKTANTRTNTQAPLKTYVFANTSGIKASTTVNVNTSATSANYNFTWTAVESRSSKFTCYIKDCLDEVTPTITSTYSLITNTRPAMKGNIYVTAADKNNNNTRNNMMTKQDLYIKSDTSSAKKNIVISWDTPTLYNGATVRSYNITYSINNGNYTTINAAATTNSVSIVPSFNNTNVNTFKYRVTCIDSYGDPSSNTLESTYPVYTNVRPSWPSDAQILIGGKNYSHYYAASTASTSSTAVTWSGASNKGSALSFYRVWWTDKYGNNFTSSYADVSASANKSYTFNFSTVSSEQGAKYKFKIRAYDGLNEYTPTDLTSNFHAIINTKPVLTFTSIATNSTYVTDRIRNNGSIITRSDTGQVKISIRVTSNGAPLKSITYNCSNKEICPTVTDNNYNTASLTTTKTLNLVASARRPATNFTYTITVSDGLDTATINTPFVTINTPPWFTAKPTVNSAAKINTNPIITKSNTTYIDIASTAKTEGAPLVSVVSTMVFDNASPTRNTRGTTVTTNINATDKKIDYPFTQRSNLSSVTQGELFFYRVVAQDECGETITQDSNKVLINTKPVVPKIVATTADTYISGTNSIIIKTFVKKAQLTGNISSKGAPLKLINIKGSTANVNIDNINRETYNLNKYEVAISGNPGNTITYTVTATDTLGETGSNTSYSITYNTKPSFNKPTVETTNVSNRIFVSGTKNIICKSTESSIKVNIGTVTSNGATLKQIEIFAIQVGPGTNAQTTKNTDCKDKSSYAYSPTITTTSYGSSGKTYLFRVKAMDNLDEYTQIDSYTVLWNTKPTITYPKVSTSAKYHTVNDDKIVINNTVKDIILNSVTSNAGAALKNTVVTLKKINATTGAMNSPISYNMSTIEANSYTLNKTYSFTTLPNAGSEWCFNVTSTDQLNESVSKDSVHFVYNTIPYFNTKPLVVTADKTKFIYLPNKDKDIIVNSAISEFIINGSKITSPGAPINRIVFTPVKINGSGDLPTVTTTGTWSSYDINQVIKSNTKPESGSYWYYKITVYDTVDQSYTQATYAVLWNTPPTLTKPIPYAANVSEYVQQNATGDIIIKSTLKTIKVRSTVNSPGAKVTKITTKHNKLSGTATVTALDTKTFSANTINFDNSLSISANQGSTHNYTLTVTDQLNESVTADSHKVTVNTIPTFKSLTINDKTTSTIVHSTTNKLTVKTEVNNAGAPMKSYTHKNNVTGTGARAVSDVVVNTTNITNSSIININNVENTRHTFTVTIKDTLNEGVSRTTTDILINTRPRYRVTDKIYINNNNTNNPFNVAHDVKTVSLSWVNPTNAGAEITKFIYSYSIDGGRTWSNNVTLGRVNNTAFNYTASENLQHLFRLYAEDSLGETTHISTSNDYADYIFSNTLLNNTIPYFSAGSVISIKSDVKCILTDSLNELNANTNTSSNITIPSTGANLTLSWPTANNKGGAMTNYLLYRSAQATDVEAYPTSPTYTIAVPTITKSEDYFKNTVTTAYHRYKLVPTDIFYNTNTAAAYNHVLLSAKIVKNIKPTFEAGNITVEEANSNKIISSEIKSITINYPKMAAKSHGLPLKYYKVYYQTSDMGNSWNSATTTNTTYTFNFSSLTQNDQYRFKVEVFDGLETSTSLVTEWYTINTIPYFTSSDVLSIDNFTNDFDLDYARSSVTLRWSPATTMGEAIKGYRIEVAKGNINNTDTSVFVQKVDTKNTNTSYVYPLPLNEKKEFDQYTFRVYAYDAYSDSRTVNSYLESCTFTIKGAFQIKRHD